MAANRIPTVFISSAPRQRDIARRLSAHMEQRGVHAVGSSHPGDPSPRGLADRLQEADGFLVVVDPSVPVSEWQRDEWFAILNEASGLTKPLIPVISGQGAPPAFLQTWEAVRLPADRKRWTSTLDRIAQAFLSPKEPRTKSIPVDILRGRERRLGEIARVAGNLIGSE